MTTSNETSQAKLPSLSVLIVVSLRALWERAGIYFGFFAWALIPIGINLFSRILDWPMASAIELISGIASVVLTAWAMASSIIFLQANLTFGDTTGKERFDKMSELSWRAVPEILIGQLIVAVAVVIGILLFIIPGLMILTWTAVMVPAIVLGGKGVIKGIKESVGLIRGRTLAVAVRYFGGLTLVAITYTIVSAVMIGAGAPLLGGIEILDSPYAALVQNVLSLPISIFWAIFSTVLYNNLIGQPPSSSVGEIA